MPNFQEGDIIMQRCATDTHTEWYRMVIEVDEWRNTYTLLDFAYKEFYTNSIPVIDKHFVGA